jgi:hypothetical protein
MVPLHQKPNINRGFSDCSMTSPKVAAVVVKVGFLSMLQKHVMVVVNIGFLDFVVVGVRLENDDVTI